VMRRINMSIKNSLLFFILFLIFNPAFAVSTSVNSLSVEVGAYQSISVTSISGSLTVTNSSPGLIIVNKDVGNTYKVYGVAAGSATIQFKDKKNTAKVTVLVKAPIASVLNGRLLASNCFQCHGTNGAGGFERLMGASSSEIYDELKKFSLGTEDPNGVMAAHAMGFSDAQLRSIANYFSNLR